MNAEETIARLRQEAQFQRDRFNRYDLAVELNDAADLMEGMAAQLAASQAREKAAVEDIEAVLRSCICEDRHNYCDGYGTDDCSGHYPGDCSEAKWRGPQVGEGKQ